MTYLIVSYFTADTPYEEEVKKLQASIEQFSLPSFIPSRPNLGSWEKNCQQKADVILEALEMQPHNVVWLDADAVIQQDPVLFGELQCDIGYHYLEHRKELLSGTLFLKNSPKVIQLVKDWIALNATNDEWDQKNLQRLVESNSSLERQIIPAEYCKIDRNRKQPNVTPVIAHYQASRKYKRIIKSLPKD